MKNILPLCALIVVAAACRKDPVNEPALTVVVKNTSIKAGDTVRFALSGNADIVTFYSGEEGNNFAYKDRTTLEGTPELSFSTQSTNAGQPAFSVLLSSDFTGAYDTTNIRNATWTNITDRFTLSTGAANTPSGTLNLQEYMKPGKPLFIAFRYDAAATFGQGAWIVQSFDVIMRGANNKVVTAANLATAGWIARDFSNTNIKWTIATNQLSITGRVSAPHVASEDWLISKALYVNKVSPDIGLPVKDISIALGEFAHVFEQPGTYDITFVATNSFGYTQRSITRNMTITVQP